MRHLKKNNNKHCKKENQSQHLHVPQVTTKIFKCQNPKWNSEIKSYDSLGVNLI